MTDVHRLYAITHSLYSGRARAYLIKQGIPFQELSTGHESFKSEDGAHNAAQHVVLP